MVIVGKTAYVSGIGPLAPEASSHVAKVGTAEEKADGVVGVDEGKKAARSCALTMVRRPSAVALPRDCLVPD